MQIVLIDDDKDLRELTQAALARFGYEVFTFPTAEDGIRYAKTTKPSLILMDLMLPGISGEEAVKLIKSDENLMNVPIVFLTGLVEFEKNSDNQTLRVDGLNYLSLGKPFALEKLLEVVRKYDVKKGQKK